MTGVAACDKAKDNNTVQDNTLQNLDNTQDVNNMAGGNWTTTDGADVTAEPRVREDN